MTVADRLGEVRARVEAACVRTGRSPDEVRLLPVSKTHGPELLAQAYDAGVRELGENRVQEVVAKAEALADRSDLRWSLIGHLQSNKVRAAAPVIGEFQALDSIKIARALDRVLQEEGRAIDVLIQVNSSAEPQKSGLPPAEVSDLAVELRHFDSLRVRGLMTVAVFSGDDAEVAACFRRMRELQEQLRQTDQAAGRYDDLSMGMSGDFELAIEHGATTVRVGQLIFGAR